MNLMLSYPVTPWMESVGHDALSSGAPFTPMVNRDINGDGMRNDRAFVFDPTTPPRIPPWLPAWTGCWKHAGPGAQLPRVAVRRIADRNSCRNGWTQSLDMRASLRPNLPRSSAGSPCRRTSATC
jgi:hypothetical protein